MEEIINKVASSGLINIDLEDWYPKGPRLQIDLAQRLFMGQILREKDLREWLGNHTWEQYQDAYVALHCSADAIIPVWAYMLIASRLAPYAKKVVMGNPEALETEIYREIISGIDRETYRDQRVIIKGCGNLPVPESAYVMLTAHLQPAVKSLMYGEACSTVPVFKA
jgi:hypothetical protein